MAKRQIGIIGSTGSIGRQAVEVILSNPDYFQVVFLTAHSNRELLEEQAKKLNVDKFILTKDDKDGRGINNLLDSTVPEMVLHSASGIGGIKPAYEIVARGIDMALANKESIVTAGRIILEKAENSGAKVIPVDSEHSAIFQCLSGQRKKSLESVTLTASGGPFRNRNIEDMGNITIKDALNHPNWSMGHKISIDSATMMNKGLELIEARYLFNIEPSKLKVIIHPESIIHSFITFSDGSTIAQMGNPDMRMPISYALGFPERINSLVKPVDLAALGKLSFQEADKEKFRCLKIATDVLLSDSNALMTAMNAGNEAAVSAFLNSSISFLQISDIVEEVLSSVNFKDATDIDDVWYNSCRSFEQATALIKKRIK